MEQRNVKQVLIWRNDLKVRKGKYGAQIAHGSLAPIFNTMRESKYPFFIRLFDKLTGYKRLGFKYKKNSFWDVWINGRFTKVVVYCNDKEELFDLLKKAQDAGIPNCIITDAGITEFHGVPTQTCLGIGPYWADEIDKITGNLKLL